MQTSTMFGQQQMSNQGTSLSSTPMFGQGHGSQGTSSMFGSQAAPPASTTTFGQQQQTAGSTITFGQGASAPGQQKIRFGHGASQPGPGIRFGGGGSSFSGFGSARKLEDPEPVVDETQNVENELPPEIRAAFEASAFEPGKIPEIPPPEVFCH